MEARRRFSTEDFPDVGDLDLRVLPDPDAGPPDPPAGPGAGRRASLFVPLLAGAAVAVALGVYGRLHTPTGIAVNVAGFSGPQTVKVWLGSVAAGFAVLQLLSALAMWGRLGGFSPSWAAAAHRWCGRLAFLAAIPVAVHCLYAIGFADYDLRSLVHSVLGCFFFGVFTTKMLTLPKKGLAGWVLPVVGGVVFTALVGVWLTSSVWYFTTFGVHL
ncbi:MULTISPECIES: DUF6529 family protein [Micromonospora]|uniref:Uncharacterized protein n=1 Tax=Micromonospora yangpuensis TaxID=683228 RepID=A0A1C6UFU0_9ACTN|nr:DUF6529 family protein [Micromonospora yangpuensis]GGM05404.1 hypothetical protein GCM10012279_23880 [Micromonospora yangpuensis]SCL52896.1 hypothetical protein GA0070617_2209 [Micromonospora yangpuensis]